jgi:hypothetical protein
MSLDLGFGRGLVSVEALPKTPPKVASRRTRRIYVTAAPAGHPQRFFMPAAACRSQRSTGNHRIPAPAEASFGIEVVAAVGTADEPLDAIRSVAGGGSVIDPKVVEGLPAKRAVRDAPF